MNRERPRRTAIGIGVSVFLLLVIGGPLLLLHGDDELSPSAQAWLARATPPADDDVAFMYLLGLPAAADADVLVAGHERLTAYRAQTASSNPIEDPLEFPPYPPEHRLARAAEPWLCQLREPACAAALFEHRPAWPSTLSAHAVLRARYRHFLAFSDFRTPLPPRINEAMPDYAYLMDGNTLNVLAALLTAEEPGPDAAIAALRDDLQGVRTQLALADTVLHKMFFLVMAANDLDAMAEIRHRHPAVTASPIAPLNATERSFDKPIQRDFAMQAAMYGGLGGQMQFFSAEWPTPRWVVSLLFKPNRTINVAQRNFAALATLATLPDADFARAAPRQETRQDAGIDLRNPIGSVLLQISTNGYVKYLARVRDLDAKIALLNASFNGELAPPFNPYYPDDPRAYTAELDELCFNGPFPDERHLRCMATGPAE